MRDQSTSRTYEMMVITFPEIEPEALLATPGTLQSYIESAGGSVLKTSNDSPWGRRRLAYPIRHQSREIRDGFYTLTYFEAEPDQIAALERDLKLDETMMRYMILHIGEMPTFPEPEPEEGEAVEGESAEQVAKADESGKTESSEEATATETPEEVTAEEDSSEDDTSEEDSSEENSSDEDSSEDDESEKAVEEPTTEESGDDSDDQTSAEEED